MRRPGVRVVGQDGDRDAPGDRDAAAPAQGQAAGPVPPPPGPAGQAPRPREAGRPRRPGRLVVVTLALGLVVTLAAAVGFGLAWNGIRSRDAARDGAVSTTEALLKDMTNFDAATIDQNFRAIATFATGTFAQQLPPTFDNPTIRDQLKKAHAQSRGEIHSLYLATGTPADQAKVYAVVDQTAVSDQYKGTVTDTLQFKVDLVRGSAGWRVDNLSLVNSTNPVLPAPAAGAGAGSTTTTTVKGR